MTARLLTATCALALLVAACAGGDPATGPPPVEAEGEPSPLTEKTAPAPEAPEPPEPEPEPAPTADPAPATAQEPPATAGDPAGLAQQITDAERTIRADGASEADVAAAGSLQQAAYRRLAATPEWRDDVLAAVPPDLHHAVVAHTDAQSGLNALTTPQPRLPAWRIVAPPPADELLGHYREAESVFGVGWEYLAAIHLVETRMGRIRGTSPAGAQGPMQFMPGTWAAYGEGDINNPRDAILAAGRYLSANGAPADMNNALFHYNRSQAYVHAISTYAEQMRADPRTFRGYYHWQVYYRTTEGDRLLPVGYDGAG